MKQQHLQALAALCLARYLKHHNFLQSNHGASARVTRSKHAGMVASADALQVSVPVKACQLVQSRRACRVRSGWVTIGGGGFVLMQTPHFDDGFPRVARAGFHLAALNNCVETCTHHLL
jgi:hypothetical protein